MPRSARSRGGFRCRPPRAGRLLRASPPASPRDRISHYFNSYGNRARRSYYAAPAKTFGTMRGTMRGGRGCVEGGRAASGAEVVGSARGGERTVARGGDGTTPG